MSQTVLLISLYNDPYTGGIPSHLAHISDELIRRGNQVAIATTSRRGAESQGIVVEKTGPNEAISVYRLPSFKEVGEASTVRDAQFPYRPELQARMARELRHVLGQVKPDVVHAHDLQRCGVEPANALFEALDGGAPAILTVHSDKDLNVYRDTLMTLQCNKNSQPFLPQAAFLDFASFQRIENGTYMYA